MFVTGNAGKLREVREILAEGAPVDIESLDLDREFMNGSILSVSPVGGLFVTLKKAVHTPPFRVVLLYQIGRGGRGGGPQIFLDSG